MRYRSLIGPIAVMAIPYVLFEYLRRTPELDLVLEMRTGHFYIVSSVALLALVIALAVGHAGSRLRNVKVSFLSLSFISLAGIFAVHGLSTPGLIMHQTHLPSITSPLSVIVATIWLWLSTLPSDHRLVTFLSRYNRSLNIGWAALVVLAGGFSMLQPHWVDVLPLNIHPFNWAVAIATAVLNLMVMASYYRSYLYSRFPLQLAIVYSSGLLLVSQLIIIQGTLWRLSWWSYHVLLLLSMVIMLIGLYRQYAANQSLVGAIRALFTSDPVERITTSISPSVKALMLATESKDPYTAGHNLRVTLYALQLAKELQVRPEQLRAVSQGTIIHDVGKIDVPDAILNKPGRLDAEERAIIEEHPTRGYEMCRKLGFMKEELGIIRWHHEKWDGTGYPDRLAGEQIPLLARIVAVADVYDALTSTRSYRKAMSQAEAMDILHKSAGSHFDPACVAAWDRVCAKGEPTSFPMSVNDAVV